jgi:alcohol dehydrogenase, propanol-preferring
MHPLCVLQHVPYGEVLVRIKACGVCHTDLHAAHGDWPVKPKLPLIPGHEGVGIIEEVGPGVTHLKVGGSCWNSLVIFCLRPL